jgi:hypothetical protein
VRFAPPSSPGAAVRKSYPAIASAHDEVSGALAHALDDFDRTGAGEEESDAIRTRRIFPSSGGLSTPGYSEEDGVHGGLLIPACTAALGAMGPLAPGGYDAHANKPPWR